MKRPFQISALAVVILVLLRIAIGWHFLHEGLTKFEKKDFSAEPYLRQARGPFASWYHEMVPDAYGERRLNFDEMSEHWKGVLDKATDHYDLDQRQRDVAQKVYQAYVDELDDYLREDKKDEFGQPVREDNKPVREYKTAFREYKGRLIQWQQAEYDPKTRQIPFERKRHHDASVKLQQDAKGWLAEVDRMENEYLQGLVKVANAEQQELAGEMPQRRSWLDRMEKVTVYALVIIGICLMIGFLTRLAALAGAVFLILAVIAPQLALPTNYPAPPPAAGNAFVVTKEVIEMLALLAICCTPAGRWAGLDYIGYGLLAQYYDRLAQFVQAPVRRIVDAILKFLSKFRKGNSDAN